VTTEALFEVKMDIVKGLSSSDVTVNLAAEYFGVSPFQS